MTWRKRCRTTGRAPSSCPACDQPSAFTTLTRKRSKFVSFILLFLLFLFCCNFLKQFSLCSIGAQGAFERLGSYMARLPHENLRVHLHWESLPTTPHCALAVRNVLPYVDSLSVAEPHIDALHSCILANDRFEARSIWTGTSLLFPMKLN